MHGLLLFDSYDFGIISTRRHEILSNAATDSSGLVRMEAAIAASWIGTREALMLC